MRFLILLCLLGEFAGNCWRHFWLRFAIIYRLFELVTLFAGQSMADEECPSFCTFNYSPVCGEFAGRQQTFGNQCALDVAKCQSKEGECSVPIAFHTNIHLKCVFLCLVSPANRLAAEENWRMLSRCCIFQNCWLFNKWQAICLQ